MSAGIVNYKLCDRNFRCEQCPFNRLMQGMLPSVELQEAGASQWGIIPSRDRQSAIAPTHDYLNAYLFALFSDCTIHLDRYYHPSHFWCKPESEGRVCLGLDPLTVKILHPIDQIVLPNVGVTYRKDQLIAWIRRQEKMIPLHSPFPGRVIDVYANLKGGDLTRVNWNEICLFYMAGEKLKKQVEGMCGEVSGLHWYQQKVSILRKYLAEAIAQQQVPELGATLADGGALAPCLEDVLGREAFDRLIRELFITSP